MFVAFICYFCFVWPALYGGFVFDDWPNLNNLSQVPASGIWAFSTKGMGLGRPLALISFALQAEHWPHNPLPFKTVNIALHLFNAGLFYSLCRLLAPYFSLSARQQAWFALLAAAFWLFLPIHASTVFYVIQRMTILSASFTLLGLIAFLQAYRLSNAGQLKTGLFVATFGVGIAYIGGVLCKENGILLGVFILLVYGLLLPKPVRGLFVWRCWIVLAACLPLLITVSYLWLSKRYLSGYSSLRDFTMGERLMTELVILWDYMQKIILPTAAGLNLYNDTFPVARTWFNPPTALIALVSWLALLCAALKLKSRYPFILFGLLWFWGGHLLESTFLGLELYFEHRNYVPSMGVVLLGVMLGFMLWNAKNMQQEARNKGADVTPSGPAHDKKEDKAGFNRILCGVLLFSFALLFTTILRLEAVQWGSPEKFALTGVVERPNSLRAWVEAANYFANQRDFPVAASLLHHVDQQWPEYPGTVTSQLLLHCLDPSVVIPSLEEQRQRLQNGVFDRSVDSTLEQILKVKKQGGCTDISWQQFRQLLEAVYANPDNHMRLKTNVVILMAYSYNAEQEWLAAAESLGRINEQKASIDFLLLKAQFTAMAGDEQQALRIINSLRDKYQDKPRQWLPNRARVETLSGFLEAKIAQDKQKFDK